MVYSLSGIQSYFQIASIEKMKRTDNVGKGLKILNHRQRGQSLTELAMVLPVLLLITIGSIDLSRIMFAYITVVNAANAGAQYASTSRVTAADTGGIVETALRDARSLPIDAPRVIATTPIDDGQGDGFQQVSVTVQYTFTFTFPAPASLSPQIPISHTATMRVTPKL